MTRSLSPGRPEAGEAPSGNRPRDCAAEGQS